MHYQSTDTVDLHKPRYEYDCDNCKFNWCCGKGSSCIYKNKVPSPPMSIKQRVNRVRVLNGYAPEFMEGEAMELLPPKFKAKIMQEIMEKE